MIYAQYDLTTGEIGATNNFEVDAETLAAAGKGQVQVADDVNGITHIIDLQTLTAIVRPPAPEDDSNNSVN